MSGRHAFAANPHAPSAPHDPNSGIGGWFRAFEKLIDGAISADDAKRATKAPAPATIGALPAGSTGTALTKAALARAHGFEIIEAIEDGAAVFVVTDGRERAVCGTPEFAARVLAGLGCVGKIK